MDELLHNIALRSCVLDCTPNLSFVNTVCLGRHHAMKRRTVLNRLATGVASLALPALAQSERRLVLGQSAPLTGPAAQLGIHFQRGARLALDRANARGGVNGRTVELKTMDDGYEPARCQTNTQALLGDDVLALFGYIGTPTSLVALPMATAAKTPFIAPFTGAQALREPFNRLAFHLRASYFDETARIVNQVTSVGMKRVAVFHQNDSYGQAGLEGVSRALKAQQLEPVATATVERNSTDVAAALGRLLPSRAEAIVQISAYKSCAAFIRAARKGGYKGQFYNVSFVGTQALASELGADARGVVVSQVMPYPFAPLTALTSEFLSAAKLTRPEVEPNYSSIEGYIAARVFLEGLRRSGAAPSRESLVAGLESMQNVDLGGFYVDLGPQKHVASSFVDLTILDADGRLRH
jgi:branched-chain amino acid transport system substrate-binding protein